MNSKWERVSKLQAIRENVYDVFDRNLERRWDDNRIYEEGKTYEQLVRSAKRDTCKFIMSEYYEDDDGFEMAIECLKTISKQALEDGE